MYDQLGTHSDFPEMESLRKRSYSAPIVCSRVRITESVLLATLLSCEFYVLAFEFVLVVKYSKVDSLAKSSRARAMVIAMVMTFLFIGPSLTRICVLAFCCCLPLLSRCRGNAVATYADGLLGLDGLVRVFEPHTVLFAGTGTSAEERTLRCGNR